MFTLVHFQSCKRFEAELFFFFFFYPDNWGLLCILYNGPQLGILDQ